MLADDWLRPLVAGLVAAAVAAALAAFAGKAPENNAGWLRIAPSPMHWAGIALGTVLVLLMGYVRLFVGSARADAETQMAILTWLIAAFALGTVAVALSVALIRRRAVRWRGARIAWRSGGREVSADLAALSSVGSDWLCHAVLRFDEHGTVLRLDPHARGALELIEAAKARAADW